MKNGIIVVSAIFASILFSGCGQTATVQEITLEAGNHELIEVLCTYEGIQRIGDPSRFINVISDDNWDPFAGEEVYEINYTVVEDQNKEINKALAIKIIDTTQPLIQQKLGSTAVVLQFTEDTELMICALKESIIESVVVTDNSSMFPLKITDENVELTVFDFGIIGERQIVHFQIADDSGNSSKATIEVLLESFQ